MFYGISVHITKCAGLLTIAAGRWSFHFIPKDKKDRFWGYREERETYNQMHLRDWGFGPFLMVCKF